ncbi:hypothetical protein PVAND_016662 [Polypedilum vanderplanki]|uniref:Leucine rich repeat protein n=1 Tax=Polypedilum vanderplanki TaxID=319348 RepID=A0A9J6BGL9_POLVA|nr:hypothetical protein PVAND_016662 [Polypedilum vanderplanki]
MLFFLLLYTIFFLSITSSELISNECSRLNDDTCFIEIDEKNSKVFRIDSDVKFTKLIAIGINKYNLGINDEIMVDVSSLVIIKSDIVGIDHEDFDALKNLKELKMAEGNLKKIHKNTFENQILLEILDLSENQIEFLPGEVFKNLANLKSLDLHGNKFQLLLSNLFDPLIKLEDINLSKNELLTLCSQHFKNKPNLKFIDLTQNNFWNLDQQTFDGLTSLVYLGLDSTPKCHMFKYGSRNSTIAIDLNEVKQDIRDGCTSSDFEAYELHAKIIEIKKSFKNY